MRKPVYEATSRFLKDFFEIGPPEVLYTYEPYAEKVAEEAAKLIDCSKEEITCIKNTTEGIFLASETLSLIPGDEVIVWGNGYPATYLPWLKKRKDGITVKVMPGEDNSKVVEALIAAMTPQTKAVTIAWAQHTDGFLPNLKRLSDVCRERGVFLIVDGVQSIGIRNLKVSELPIDMLIVGGQKYLGAGMGIGFMYIRKEIIPTLKDIKIGMRSMERFDTESYTIRNTARRFEDGTMNLFGIVALHAALEHINKIGIQTIEEQSIAFLNEAKSILRNHSIPFLDYEHQSNAIAITVSDPVALNDHLRERSMYTKPFKGILRVSFLHDSSIKEFKLIAETVAQWFSEQSPIT
jgi:selenocysteine lyase/cysteine desulfurase